MNSVFDYISQKVLLVFILNLMLSLTAWGQVKRVWLTHKSSRPDKIVINWQTVLPGNSVVLYGRSDSYEWKKKVDGHTTMHHVEIELKQKDIVYHYSVETGDQKSSDASFKAYPKDNLRVAVIANMAGRTNLSKISNEDVHLLLSCGHHVAWKLSDYCEELPAGEVVMECDEAFGNLIDAYPEIFKEELISPNK